MMGGHSPGEKGVIRAGSIGLEAQDLVTKVRSKEPLAEGAVGDPQKIVPGVGSAVDPGVHRHEHGKVRQRTVVPQNPIRFARAGVEDGEDVRPVALERHDGRGRVLAAQSDDPLRDARQGGLQAPTSPCDKDGIFSRVVAIRPMGWHSALSLKGWFAGLPTPRLITG